MDDIKEKGLIEKLGSFLPESNLLFLMLIAFLIVTSFFAQGTHPSAMETMPSYSVVNLLSIEGMRWILSNILHNFIAYPPLALLVVGVLGFGFAEKTGFLGTLLKVMGRNTSENLVLPVVILLGINSSIASDAGYIVLIPLAGALYAGLGRNPLIGIAAAFASVSAGFGAAMIPTPGDGMLGNITKSVYENTFHRSLDLNPMLMNYIFMFFSTLFLTVLLTFVTKIFVEKRASHYEYTLPEDIDYEGELSQQEKRGLRNAGITFGITLLAIVFLWAIGILRTYTDTNGIKVIPILNNIIVILIALFLFPSLAYAKALSRINNGQEYIEVTVEAMRDIAYVLVFAIFAGNFLGIFNYSGLDKFVANHGAMILQNLHIQNPYVLIVSFILISATVNIFVGSATAKWAIFAPIFVPMLIMASDNQLGAEVIQAAYRIGDSSTNIITPLLPYVGIILVSAKHYNHKFEIGNLISLMVPYSIAILVGWTLFFILWMILGLPFDLSGLPWGAS
ncbi:AbgT family transporter [Entomospira entomophila]|uniref:AbgT family transporter n=1 Tax=Entomospira entomophila TaxID=2719988 RepID=A0A968GAP1_9SPIO|nr:AbgT family transporter [Entomospira entomophilus]NIZ40178.1 AbgT family transporter [Entomospira entomophilus]WDI35737.1 AbgT family transporter [Entomospira entomophilus]